MKNEHILGIKQRLFNTYGMHSFAGASLYPALKLTSVTPADLVLGQRDLLETDESVRQIIPYTAVRNVDGAYLVYRRNGGGESRLDAKLSIGFGGHVDLQDVSHLNSVINLEDTLSVSCSRELHEELGITMLIRPEHHGWILDDSDPVGRVHVGVAQVMQLHSEGSEVYSPENQIEIIGWLTPEQALAQEDNWENWSYEFLTYLKLYGV